MTSRSPRPWIRSTALNPGECVESLVLRLAPLGCVTAPELLKLGLGLDSRALPMVTRSREALSRLATIGSFDIDELISASWKATDRSVTVGLREIPLEWLVADRRRTAPGILARDRDGAWIRSLWQVSALPCDPVSGECLIDTCACGSPMFWSNAKTVWGCQFCGADVRKRIPTFVPDDLHQLVKEFSTLFQSQRVVTLPPPFNGVQNRTLFAAMSWLGTMVKDENGIPHAHHAVHGYQLLKEWPGSFDRWVHDRLSRSRVTGQSGAIAAIEASIHRSDERALKDILLARLRVTIGASIAVQQSR